MRVNRSGDVSIYLCVRVGANVRNVQMVDISIVEHGCIDVTTRIQLDRLTGVTRTCTDVQVFRFCEVPIIQLSGIQLSFRIVPSVTSSVVVILSVVIIPQARKTAVIGDDGRLRRFQPVGQLIQRFVNFAGVGAAVPIRRCGGNVANDTRVRTRVIRTSDYERVVVLSDWVVGGVKIGQRDAILR